MKPVEIVLAALAALPEEEQDTANVIAWCVEKTLQEARAAGETAAEAESRINAMIEASCPECKLLAPFCLTERVRFLRWSLRLENLAGTVYDVDQLGFRVYRPAPEILVTSGELKGWREITDLPALDELNGFLARRDGVGRKLLIDVAGCVPRYRVPSHFRNGDGMVHGLTFGTLSGTVLLVFPSPWPSDPLLRRASLYTLGNATAEDYSGVVGRFNEEFQRLVLPADAHAADGSD